MDGQWGDDEKEKETEAKTSSSSSHHLLWRSSAAKTRLGTFRFSMPTLVAPAMKDRHAHVLFLNAHSCGPSYEG